MAIIRVPHAESGMFPAEVVTLVPYAVARRLRVIASEASSSELTVLMAEPDDAAALSELAATTGLRIRPVATPAEEVVQWLDRLSGLLETEDLWLQRRHIIALARLVDHSVNLGQVELVRGLVDRGLEFAPYSAELWLMKARVAVKRQDVVEALTVASQIAPNDRRILRWIHSLKELDEPESDRSVTTTGGDVEQADEGIRGEALRAVAQDPGAGLTPTDSGTSFSEEAFTAARNISRLRNLAELVAATAEALKTVGSAQSATVFFKSPEGWVGFSTDPRLQSRLSGLLPKENRLAAQAIRQGLPIVIADTASRLEDTGYWIQDTDIRSFALLPIRTNEHVGGLAYLNYPEVDRPDVIFDPDLGRCIELIASCASSSAVAIEHKRSGGENLAIDRLTGAYTMAQLERSLATEIDRARRYRFSVSLLSLDIDDFSRINLDHGPSVADGVLQEVARRIQSVDRSSDLVARRVDDEFLIMLPQTTAKGAVVVVRRVQAVAREPVEVEGKRVELSISIGLATFPDQAGDAGELLRASEIALFSAKAEGKGRARVADTLTLSR